MTAALDKRVHVVGPALLPEQVMVEYEASDDLAKREIRLGDLPPDWGKRETRTQHIGDAWLDAAVVTLRVMPSVIAPVAAAPDRDVLINHRHADVGRVRIVGTMSFTLDPRLFESLTRNNSSNLSVGHSSFPRKRESRGSKTSAAAPDPRFRGVTIPC